MRFKPNVLILCVLLLLVLRMDELKELRDYGTSISLKDYNVLKTALLRRYELTDDGFKKKFPLCRPEQC